MTSSDKNRLDTKVYIVSITQAGNRIAVVSVPHYESACLGSHPSLGSWHTAHPAVHPF